MFVSIHRDFHQNRFVIEYARKKKAKISESRSLLERYRRTYVLNKNPIIEYQLQKAKILELRSLLERYRRTYVLNKNSIIEYQWQRNFAQ